MTDPAAKIQESQDLMRMVGHELRAPLNAILQTADLILLGTEGEVNQAVRDDVHDIRVQGEQALEVIDKILDLVRMENLGNCRAALDLSPVIYRTQESLQPLADTFSRRVVIADLPEELPLVWANGDSLRRALHLLLSNVIRYAGQRLIRLSVSVQDSVVVVSVQDGHRVDHSERLPLAHVLRLKRDDRLSLDVFLCKRLIEYQGGELWISSGKKARTLCWNLSLPIAEGTAVGLSQTEGARCQNH